MEGAKSFKGPGIVGPGVIEMISVESAYRLAISSPHALLAQLLKRQGRKMVVDTR